MTKPKTLQLAALAGVIWAALPVAPASANPINVIANLGVNPTSVTSAPLVVHTAIPAGAFQDGYLFRHYGRRLEHVRRLGFADSRLQRVNLAVHQLGNVRNCG